MLFRTSEQGVNNEMTLLMLFDNEILNVIAARYHRNQLSRIKKHVTRNLRQ